MKSIHDLPNETIDEVLKHFSLIEMIKSIRPINKEWRDIADRLVIEKIEQERNKLQRAINNKENDVVLGLILTASAGKYLPLLWMQNNENIDIVNWRKSKECKFNEKMIRIIGDFLQKNPNSDEARDLKNNLSYANLRGCYLPNINLSNANLRNANLSNASLGNANLSGCDLRDANLSRIMTLNSGIVNLSNANLSNATLSTGISGSVLQADLTRANLCGATLNNQLTESNFLNGKLISLLDDIPIKEKLDKWYDLYNNQKDPHMKFILRYQILKNIETECQSANDIDINKKLKEALEVIYSHKLFGEHRDKAVNITNSVLGFFSSDNKNVIESASQKVISNLIKQCSAKIDEQKISSRNV